MTVTGSGSGSGSGNGSPAGMAAGAAVIDTLYAALGVAGASALLRTDPVRTTLGAVVRALIGLWTLGGQGLRSRHHRLWPVCLAWRTLPPRSTCFPRKVIPT